MPGPPQPWSTRIDSADVEPQPTRVAPPNSGRGWLGTARPWVVVLLAGAWVAAAMVFDSDEPSAAVGWTASAPISTTVGAADRPTPTAAPSRERLGAPRWVSPDAGPYQFLGLQRSSEVPITYDPCRPVPYVVNERTAPPAAAAVVAEAVDIISEATGLQLVYEGTTDEVPVRHRPVFQPDRYGDRWAPVLIAWSDPAEYPALDGGVAGVGGSTAVSTSLRGPDVYVSGMVTLDGPQLGTILRGYTGTGKLHVRAVILHELGHLLGLDHIDDRSQLMHAESSATAFGPGDLAGLVQLGAGPCVPKL